MNDSYKPKIKAFLDLDSIAVLGYSTDKEQPANYIYKKLAKNNYKVYAVNPKADQVKDVECFKDVKSIPGEVQGAMICTPSSATEDALKECAENNIKHIWMHKGFGTASYNAQAFAKGKELGLEVIPGGCPMMFLKPDFFHRCMGWFQTLPE